MCRHPIALESCHFRHRQQSYRPLHHPRRYHHRRQCSDYHCRNHHRPYRPYRSTRPRRHHHRPQQNRYLSRSRWNRCRRRHRPCCYRHCRKPHQTRLILRPCRCPIHHSPSPFAIPLTQKPWVYGCHGNRKKSINPARLNTSNLPLVSDRFDDDTH